jgi:hypothetical protein
LRRGRGYGNIQRLTEGDALEGTFLDLQGASGAIYRFRLWGDQTTPTAGNYVVRSAKTGELLLIGVTHDLLQIRKSALESTPDAELYVRLNVARAIRHAEHEDLAAKYPDAEIAQQGLTR